MKEEGYFKDLSRRDYINKANEIVRKEGPQALTIRRIARELNCSSASLYHYFESLEELLYYAQIGFLDFYLEEISKSEKNWKDAWDVHIGIWECYTRAAFTYPQAFNTIFFSPMSKKFTRVLREYHELFPEYLNLVSPYLHRMLETPDFQERDYLMCLSCVEAGVLAKENARPLNQITCMIYKGYLKGIIDNGIRPDEIEGKVTQFLNDFKSVAALLAKKTTGHPELDPDKIGLKVER